MKKLIICDIQPHDEKIFHFDMYEFAEFVNEYDKVLVLFNGKEFWWEDEGEMAEYYFEIWIDIDKCFFVDKGYWFFRDVMDKFYDEDPLIDMVKLMEWLSIDDYMDISQDIYENTEVSSQIDYDSRDSYGFWIPTVLKESLLEFGESDICWWSCEACLKETLILSEWLWINLNKKNSFIY